MGNMADVHIIWPPVKQKVVNHLHTMRDLMEWGEGQQIMVVKVGSTCKVMEHVCGGEESEGRCSINLGSLESKDLSKVSILFLVFPRISLCAITMPCYWRARNRSRGNNIGEIHSEASPSSMHDSIPSRGGDPVSKPFNWGDQYMAEKPTTI